MNRHGGILDKFMGDGIMMIFGCSDHSNESACNALGAAVEIQGKMDKIRRELRRFELPEISIHIGVCTGTATACSIGTGERLAYTYIGDAVNLAKRLQDLAGPGEILVSETTANELEASTDSIKGLCGLHPLPPVSLKGRQDDVTVYRAEFQAAGSNGK